MQHSRWPTRPRPTKGDVDTSGWGVAPSVIEHLAYLPITEPEEVRAFLRKLPLAVDPAVFSRLVLGFPRNYLASTPPVEIVKHFALMGSLETRSVVSSVSREGSLWRLCVVARDRKALFSRIAGSLSCFGLDIVFAEAFANANSMVLDTFACMDREGRFAEDGERRRFQVFLEQVVDGKVDLEAAMAELPRRPAAVAEPFGLAWDDQAHPSATRLTLSGHDFLGLLYAVSRCMSERGFSIEVAHIETAGDRVRDDFYLTRDGAKLTPAMKVELEEKLGRLGEQPGALAGASSGAGT